MTLNTKRKFSHETVRCEIYSKKNTPFHKKKNLLEKTLKTNILYFHHFLMFLSQTSLLESLWSPLTTIVLSSSLLPCNTVITTPS